MSLVVHVLERQFRPAYDCAGGIGDGAGDRSGKRLRQTRVAHHNDRHHAERG